MDYAAIMKFISQLVLTQQLIDSAKDNAMVVMDVSEP